MKKQKSDLFSVRDLQSVLNNAVIISGKPSTGEISDARKRKLREYAQAIVEPALVHVEEKELLTPQELVHVLSAAALFVYIRCVQGGEKLPASKEAKKLYE